MQNYLLQAFSAKYLGSEKPFFYIFLRFFCDFENSLLLLWDFLNENE